MCNQKLYLNGKKYHFYIYYSFDKYASFRKKYFVIEIYKIKKHL